MTHRRILLQTLTWMAALGLLLFLPAGRLDWWQAWTFLAVMLSTNLAVGIWLARNDPGLLQERVKMVGTSEPNPVNRIYMTALVVAFHGWFLFMGWEARQPSPWPVWASLLGAAGIVACMYICWLTFRVNSFAASTVRLQEDRAQTVISTGPYAVIRHPMYFGATLWMLGMVLLIGTPWDLLGAACVMGVIVVRALGEEKMLASGLPGYANYMQKVRFRLLPGVW